MPCNYLSVGFWRRTTVRIDGSGDYDGPGDFVPPVPSQHERLLAEVDALPLQGWSTRALRVVLQGVRDHRGIEDIAIIDAWVEDDDSFCVVYTPPWRAGLAGTRRRRGDLDPMVQLAPDAVFETPADPDEYGSMVLDDISQPLARMAERLRFDAHGLGWWGTLADVLPERPRVEGALYRRGRVWVFRRASPAARHRSS